jgi:hypothetical protein
MLARDPSAVAKTRRAARWAIGHNVALLAGLGLAALNDPREPGLCIPPAIYCCLSLAHAWLLRRAATAMEAYAAAQEAEPAPIHAEIAALNGAR